jgi:hypothetical protein
MRPTLLVSHGENGISLFRVDGEERQIVLRDVPGRDVVWAVTGALAARAYGEVLVTAPFGTVASLERAGIATRWEDERLAG